MANYRSRMSFRRETHVRAHPDRRFRIRRAVAVLMIIAATGCSSSSTEGNTGGTGIGRAGKPDVRPSGAGDKDRTTPPNAATTATGTPSATAPTATAPGAVADDRRTLRRGLATASASVADAAGDAYGNETPPPYADVLAATLQGRGRTLLMTMTFAHELPSRMPDDDERFVAAIAVRGSDGRPRWTFGARCSTQGWRAFSRERGNDEGFKGRFDISSGTVTLVVRWSSLGGPHRFEWAATGTWVEATAVPTYAVDIAPDNGRAAFPGR